MPKPIASLNELLAKAASDPKFLKTYLRDPNRLSDRYEIDASVIDAFSNSGKLIDAASNQDPATVSKLMRTALDAAQVDADFGDSFGDRGFKDSFKDGGGFADRHRDNN